MVVNLQSVGGNFPLGHCELHMMPGCLLLVLMSQELPDRTDKLAGHVHCIGWRPLRTAQTSLLPCFHANPSYKEANGVRQRGPHPNNEVIVSGSDESPPKSSMP